MTARNPAETLVSSSVASRLANWNEVRQLVGVMGEEGAGVFEVAVDGQRRRGRGHDSRLRSERQRGDQDERPQDVRYRAGAQSG